MVCGRGIVLRIKPFGQLTPPLEWFYNSLEFHPTPCLVLKITTNILLAITNNSFLVNTLTAKLDPSYVVGFESLKDFCKRILDNIRECRRILLYSSTPTKTSTQILIKILLSLGRIHSFKLKQYRNQTLMFKAELIPHNNSLDKIVLYTVYGIGRERELGFGSINSVCMEKQVEYTYT